MRDLIKKVLYEQYEIENNKDLHIFR